MSGILGAESITLRRRAAGSWSQGRFVPGATTDTTIRASVQPMGPDEQQHLSEGQRARSPRKVYTTTELRTVDQHAGTEADQLVIDGVVFEVDSVERERSVIPHYKATAMRLQEGS